MKVLIVILVLVCAGEFYYAAHMKKQLKEWLGFLKDVHEAPERNSFVKGKGILAEINFELNGLLEESRRQFVKMQRAEAANQQLLTDLSHDVRTPLASLIGYLEALEGQAADNRAEYIHVAYRKALDLQELVDMLFQWFKLTSDAQLYQMKFYDINELTREIVIEHIPQLEKNRISFLADISDEEWLVRIDRTAYARIVNNLLSNAVKHGKCSLIEIGIQKNNDQVVVSVINDGTAIPERELPFLFDRLYKCDASRSEAGNGLGLAIVRELTNAMSGEIAVRSTPEGRTAFYLSLPLIVREN